MFCSVLPNNKRLVLYVLHVEVPDFAVEFKVTTH